MFCEPCFTVNKCVFIVLMCGSIHQYIYIALYRIKTLKSYVLSHRKFSGSRNARNATRSLNWIDVIPLNGFFCSSSYRIRAIRYGVLYLFAIRVKF